MSDLIWRAPVQRLFPMHGSLPGMVCFPGFPRKPHVKPVDEAWNAPDRGQSAGRDEFFASPARRRPWRWYFANAKIDSLPFVYTRIPCFSLSISSSLPAKRSFHNRIFMRSNIRKIQKKCSQNRKKFNTCETKHNTVASTITEVENGWKLAPPISFLSFRVIFHLLSEKGYAIFKHHQYN